MKYLPLSAFRNAWVFRHAEMPVPEEDQAHIKLFTAVAALDVWKNNISKEAETPDDFAETDWPANPDNWADQGEWQETWETDEDKLPEILAENLPWEPDTTVYFCIDSETILETSWVMFKKHWRNFLFFDDETLLLGRRRKQAVQFHQDGTCSVGRKG